MAASAVENVGKTEFAKQVLFDNPFATSPIVNKAWAEAGHEGTISDSLVNQLRAELGLAGNLRGKARAKSHKPSAAKTASKSGGKQRGRKPRETSPAEESAAQRGTPSRKSGIEKDLLDLEAAFDELLFKVVTIGELPEVEKSLRATRRLLYRHFPAGRS